MANWLTKILQPVMPKEQASSKQALSTVKQNRPPATLSSRTYKQAEPAKLPNASVVYGIAASILFVMALLSLTRGAWFTALLLLLPAFCFLGFALHFLKHPNS